MKSTQKIIITTQDSTISSQDRGLNYGDGFFTTAYISAGRVEHWALHKDRLVECATRLAFPQLDLVAIENAIMPVIHNQPEGVLKIVVTRGIGGRGYELPVEPEIWVLIANMVVPVHYPQLRATGVHLEISPIRLAKQPLLAGLKTLNRLEQVLIKHAMQSQDCDDVVVLDSDGFVIESSAANIFAINQGQVYSPVLTECGIEGVYLKSLCAKLTINFTSVTLHDLLAMDAVYTCNSLTQIVPVKSIVNKQFNVQNSKQLLMALLAKES
ncbi:aminodeoxychorismate lyase [Pseudoalteromonas mariniglutinosa]|uniref:aminodeoxychorismate lyase n=1 Tax=Pseudoalteromonas mariniglutinosa TaxID=206042 RepID=UPI00384D6BAB